MAIPQANVDFLWSTVVNPRLGLAYGWGGSLSPNDLQQGTDCSGMVSAVIEALLNGPQMNWNRQFWTGTFAGLTPGQTGPFGLVCIPSPDGAPPDAACIVAVLQDPDPSNAHMICQVQHINIEMGGPHNNLAISPEATDIHDGEFNQWLYLPGPIIGTPAPPPLSQADQYAQTVIDTGHKLGVTPRGIQIALATCLVESNFIMYANSNDPASLNFPHQGVGSDHMSVGLFQQQDSGWGPLSCRMDAACSAQTFYQRLAQLNYNDPRQTPGWYAQQVQVSAFPDRYDQRFDDAVALYTRLINTPSGDDMAAVPQQQWDDLYRALCAPIESQSPFRTLGEQPTWTRAQMLGNLDGFNHPEWVEWAAAHGDPIELARLTTLATGDAAKYPDRVEDIRLAQQVLARIAGATTPITPVPVPAPAPTPTPDPAPAPTPTPAPGTNSIGPSGWIGIVGVIAQGILWILQQNINLLPPQWATGVSGLLAFLTALGIYKAPNQAVADSAPVTPPAPPAPSPPAAPPTPGSISDLLDRTQSDAEELADRSEALRDAINKNLG